MKKNGLFVAIFCLLNVFAFSAVNKDIQIYKLKKELYEEYRSYFTCRISGARPGNDVFILIREGIASWLTQSETPMSAAFSPRPAERDRCQNGLVGLLAKIVTMEVLANGT